MADVELNLDYYEGGSFQGTPKDYIARMARNSVISIQGASQGADTIYEGLSKMDEDGKMWLPSYLRKEFDRTNIEENYIKFNRRLLHASLKRFLIMQMIVSIAAIIFLLAINTDYLLRSLPDVVVQAVLFILSFVLFLIVFREQLTQRLPYFYTIVSIVIPLVLLGLDIGLQSFYVFSADNGTHLPWAFYVISAIYSFMPVQKDWVVILIGGITSIVYLLFSGLIIYTNDEVNMLKRLFADGVYYFCINCLGIMSRFLSEIVLRRSFADRRSCVESRFKLDYEKEQEEKLLLTIIPKHIAKEVSEDLREAIADVTIGDDSDFEDETNERDNLKKKNKKTSPFSRQASQSDKLAPYSNEYELVSILFADIVNFTPLTTTLKVKDLVAMLNDLFAKFDEAAERNNCLRIKILGDCYYCVSGIPEPTADHAINCVKMGLDMIGVIAGVRTETGVDVDMRIGVHSGRVISGLLGIRKWQFDVWSTDTTIANKMEQSGRPGRVHVTGQTLGHLRGNFDYEPSDGADKEPYLKERNIQTYLIIADPQTDKFIKEVLETPPTITLLTTELEKRISKDYENGENDNSEGYSDDSSESGFEEEKELTEKRLRKHYRVFPLEYIQGETEFKDIETFGTDSISTGYDSSLQLSSSLSSQMSPENLPTMPQNKSGNRLYEKKVNATGGVGKKIFDRSNSVVPRRRSTATNNDPNTPVGRDRRTASSTKSLTDYSHLRARADEYMRNVIDTMPISESTKSGSRQLDNRTLMFQNRRWEKSYMLQPDPLFKYYHLCVIFILICIMAIQVIIAAYTSFYFWAIFGIGMILLLSVIPFTFIGQIWMTLKDPKKEADFISPPQREQPIAQFLYNNGKEIVKNFTIRMIIFVCATAVVSLLAIFMIVECPKMSPEAPSQSSYSSSYFCASEQSCMHLLCYYPWYFTYSFALALAALNIFVRMHFLMKLILYLAYFAFYSVAILELRQDIFQATGMNDTDLYTGSPALSNYPGLSHVIYLAVVVVILHVIDRKEEFVHRLDYVLKKQLKKEQIMANQTRLVNKILLQNILPEHVAREYLSESHSEDQLYHETHSSVAVMFASIPSFADFWELNGEKDTYNNGIGALKVLNSIVAEFDGLLFDPRFSCIEKIKVIGSTYMAACGLSHSGTSGRKGAIMVDFGREMAKKLREVSSEAVHTMELRVGIECGPLIAGVVGRTKPLYDIWGDTVNMASRMDYTGEAGKIHVTEATAKVLMQEGISCEKRGTTYVKGKGEIITYWISQTDHSNLTMSLPIIEETEDNLYHEDSSDHETEL